MLTVTVCIATYNRPLSLKRCLTALSQQTDKNFDVVIIDGEDMSHGSQRIYTRYKKKLSLRIIHDSTPHLAYIRDRLWKEATGNIVAAIDDDVVVDPCWIGAIKGAFAKNKKLGGVTGPTVVPQRLLNKRDVFFFHTTTHWFWKRVATVYFWLFMNGEKYEIGKIYPSGAWSPGSNFPASKRVKKPIVVDYLEACNYAIPKKILEQIGGYDLGYVKTSEWCEIDIAFRVRRSGYQLLFDPHVSVEHWVDRGGVYNRRMLPVHRIQNFIRFYLLTYFPKTVGGYSLFCLYCLFVLLYYSYLSVTDARASWQQKT